MNNTPFDDASQPLITADTLDTCACIIPLAPGKKTPLRAGSVGKGKHQRLGSADRARLREAPPGAGLGLLTGRDRIDLGDGRWGHLIVIDCDVKTVDGVDVLGALEARPELGELPPTIQVGTPSGGLHLYYLLEPLVGPELDMQVEALADCGDNRLLNLDSALVDIVATMPGAPSDRSAVSVPIDIQSEGRYVAMPPTVLAGGGAYRYADDSATLAALPRTWVEYLAGLLATKARHGRVADRPRPSDGDAYPPVPLPSTDDERDGAREYRHERLERARATILGASLSIEGQRGRHTLFGLICRLVCDQRLPVHVIVELLSAVYNPRLRAAGTTEWSAEELEKTAWEARTRGVSEMPAPPSYEEWSATRMVEAAQRRGRGRPRKQPRSLEELRSHVQQVSAQERGKRGGQTENMQQNPAQSTPVQSTHVQHALAAAGDVDEWDDCRLHRTEKGALKPSYENLVVILSSHPAWVGKLRTNRLTRKREVSNGAPVREAGELTDDHYGEIRYWAGSTFGFSTRESDVISAVREVAARNPYHPIHDWLTSLVPADSGSDLLDTWLSRFAGVEDTSYTRAVGRRFMIGLIARAMKPGCKLDTMMVLRGAQGVGKSSLGLALMHDPSWFGEATMHVMASRDALLVARSKWIVEQSELAALKRQDVETIKSFLATAVDEYRSPYGKEKQAYPRSFVFFGTTNDAEYLVDATGNRRFWPVTVGQRVDLEGLVASRDALFAAAYAAWRSGEAWWLTSDEEALAEAPRAEAEQSDPWEGPITQWLNMRPHEDMTSARILGECLAIPVERHDRRGQLRVVRVLRTLGYQRTRRTTGPNVYVRATQNTEQE